jgi:hypothetical protein
MLVLKILLGWSLLALLVGWLWARRPQDSAAQRALEDDQAPVVPRTNRWRRLRRRLYTGDP